MQCLAMLCDSTDGRVTLGEINPLCDLELKTHPNRHAHSLHASISTSSPLRPVFEADGWSGSIEFTVPAQIVVLKNGYK